MAQMDTMLPKDEFVKSDPSDGAVGQGQFKLSKDGKHAEKLDNRKTKPERAQSKGGDLGKE